MDATDECLESETKAGKPLFVLRLPFYVGLLFLSGLLAITIYDPDILEFLYLIVAVPIVLIFFWAYSSYNTGVEKRSALLALLICGVTSWFIVWNSFNVRSEARWLVGASTYKRKVLSQADSPNALLKHIEWDGWGWAGIGNTEIYLVFDPDDSLSAARKKVPGKFNGIPCEVPSIHRLESHWYTVTFYTDASWDSCM